MKRTFPLMLVMFIVALTMAACNSADRNESAGNEESNEQSNEGSKSLTAWAWDPNFNIAALETAKQHYDGNVELEIIENAQADIIQKLNAGLSSGTMNGMPNIVLIEDYRAQSFLQAYPDMFYEITDYMNVDDFANYKIETTSIDDKQYGLPFDSGVAGLYVRTDYLEEAGYTVVDITNIDWQQFIEIGKDIKEATGKAMLTLDPDDLGQIRMMIQSAGAWYVGEDGKTPTLADNQALEKAFEVYKSMIDADIVEIISDWSQFVGAFNSGNVASVPTGNWITPSIKAEASQSGNWAVVPLPKLSMDESVNTSNLGGSSWYVLNVDGKETAAEFLAQTFGSNEELYQSLVTDIGVIGSYLPASSGEAYSVEDEFFGGQQIIADFSQWTEKIPAVNYGMHTYAIEDIIVTSMQSYLGGAELSEVLNNAQSQAETQIR